MTSAHKESQVDISIYLRRLIKTIIKNSITQR